MTIHIIGLRKGEANPQKDFAIKGSSLENLFCKIEEVVAMIPEGENYNCYYTVFHPKDCDDIRSFGYQEVIPIDIDHVADEHLSEVTKTVTDSLNLQIEDVIIVYSGHGIQILVKSPFIIDDAKYFSDYRNYYKNMASHIQQAIKAKNLTGDVDTAVWSASRLMRLPLTINRKDGMPDVESRLINRTLKDVPFDLTNFKPEVEDIKRINVRTNIQKEGVLQCPFLNWCNENQLEVSEPQWHAMIGVLAWIPEIGAELCHKYSEQHERYNPKQVDEYFSRALKLTGPRTCTSISQCWEGCTSCAFARDQEINTPAVLKTRDYIKTRDTGFHFIIPQQNGKDKLEPDFEGLVKYFKQEFNFIVHPTTSTVYVWREKTFTAFEQVFEGGYWHPLLDSQVEAFALSNFRPFAKDKVRTEFLKLVLISNHVKADFFESVTGYLNFQNGILNTKTGELLPHDKTYGFTYMLPFEYNKEAICPRFDRFLTEVLDEDSAKVLMEFAGMTAACEPNNKFEKALMLTGTGANGKSIFMFLFRHLIGEQNCTAANMRDLQSPEGRFLLHNKIANIVAEENPKALLNNSDLFKALVTGERMTGKILYKNTFSFKPTAKMITSYNELPMTDDTSKGLFRRCLIINFPNSFEGREDIHLIDDLKKEASGIWNRIIEAYLRLIKNDCKFTDSASIKEEIQDYREFNDSIVRFMDEYLIDLPRTIGQVDIPYTPIRAVYEVYCNEVRKDNQYPVSLMKFSLRLKQKLGKDRITRKTLEDGTKRSAITWVDLKIKGGF